MSDEIEFIDYYCTYCDKNMKGIDGLFQYIRCPECGNNAYSHEPDESTP